MGNSKQSKTLDELGLHFIKDDHEGGVSVLRNKETGEKYEDQGQDEISQELSEALIQYVYEFLEKDLQLEKKIIPVDARPEDPKGFVFMSKNALTSEKLMILIQGSGEVRSGLWSRRLAVRESFESGTMVPYIEQAKKEGFGVIITNGNQNEDSRRPIMGSENPEAHFVYVWNAFIKKAEARHIVIVAHSYGGKVVLHGLENIEEARKRIKAVAFTNSSHKTEHTSKDIIRWLKERARNWVVSSKPLDTPASLCDGNNYKDDCDKVSAGTKSHYETSHFAKESVFCFLKEKLEAANVSQMNIACFDGRDISTISATDAADAIASFLKMDKSSMVDPPADDTRKCQSLCCLLKEYGRLDIIQELRSKIQAGMTGPLMDNGMLYMKIDFTTRRDLTRALCGNDIWKRVASKLGIPGDHIGYYERKENPAEAVLQDDSNNRLTVEMLYDVIVCCEASALADKYL